MYFYLLPSEANLPVLHDYEAKPLEEEPVKALQAKGKQQKPSVSE